MYSQCGYRRYGSVEESGLIVDGCMVEQKK